MRSWLHTAARNLGSPESIHAAAAHSSPRLLFSHISQLLTAFSRSATHADEQKEKEKHRTNVERQRVVATSAGGMRSRCEPNGKAREQLSSHARPTLASGATARGRGNVLTRTTTACRSGKILLPSPCKTTEATVWTSERRRREVYTSVQRTSMGCCVRGR